MSSTPPYQDKIVSETNEELSKDVPLTAEHAAKTINFMIKQMQGLVLGHSTERGALLRALATAQKDTERMRKILHNSRWSRFKLFIKKILIAKGWYEISSDELHLIHYQDYGVEK